MIIHTKYNEGRLNNGAAHGWTWGHGRGTQGGGCVEDLANGVSVDLGCGRIVVSERAAPNISVDPVCTTCMKWMSGSPDLHRDNATEPSRGRPRCRPRPRPRPRPAQQPAHAIWAPETEPGPQDNYFHYPYTKITVLFLRILLKNNCTQSISLGPRNSSRGPQLRGGSTTNAARSCASTSCQTVPLGVLRDKSDGRCRKTATEYDRKPGIKRLRYTAEWQSDIM
jgi:hypothetical protein